MPSAPAAGDFLVATELLTDPNFAGSVVLLCEHDEQGTLGLVLNRPLSVRLPELVTGDELLGCEAPVLWGGPVKSDALHALKDGAPGPDAVEVYPGLAFGGQLDDLIDAWNEGIEVRFYLGYAGWESGQLDGEIAEGAWHVVRSRPELVFPERPDALWGQLKGELDPAWRHLKHQPRDPELN
ncbi:MAG: hypothetical protein CMJ94_15665 [Planctomycetes bacterium]|nr:hypothetical protein [Planctomycetota bacterium]